MPLAQFNIARGRWPLDDPRMAEFNRALPGMSALARRSAGFIWQLEGSRDLPPLFGDPQMTWTLSLWRDEEALADFAFRTIHRRFFKRRADWFPALDHVWLALWPIEPGRRPTLEEALAKKAQLDRDGPSDEVFGWERFPHLARLRENVA